MTGFDIHLLLNLSVLVTLVVLLVKIKHVPVSLYPFAALIALAAINEVLSIVLIYTHNSNSINGNVYILFEFVLWCVQFCKWGTLSPKRYSLIVALGLTLWVADNFFVSTITANNSLARIAYAFLFVFLAIDLLNRRIVFGREAPHSNTILTIIVGSLLFFGCKAYVEVFNAFDLGFSINFYANVWFSLSVINALTNILYAIALLCIPSKQEFLLQS